jgi:hypothetical protein
MIGIMRRGRRYGAAIGVAVLIAAAGAVLQWDRGDGPAGGADPTNAGQVARGAML